MKETSDFILSSLVCISGDYLSQVPLGKIQRILAKEHFGWRLLRTAAKTGQVILAEFTFLELVIPSCRNVVVEITSLINCVKI